MARHWISEPKSHLTNGYVCHQSEKWYMNSVFANVFTDIMPLCKYEHHKIHPVHYTILSGKILLVAIKQWLWHPKLNQSVHRKQH